jgi:hypothetical protein
VADAPEPASDAGGLPSQPAAAPGRGRGGRQSALVVLLLAAVAVVLTWPAAAHLSSVAFDRGDPLLTTWILAWDLHALATAPLRFFDANMFHPNRGTLAYTEHLVGLVPLVAPARLAGAGPLLAHNLVWLATFPLTGLTMFWLVRHLTGHAGAAAVAAVLYAFSHFRFGQLGHIQVLSHQWLPLLLLGLHRAARTGGRWRDVSLAALALTLQALSSVYQALFAGIAVGIFAAWLGLPAARPPLGRPIARGILLGALAAMVLLPFFLPYRSVRDEIGLTRDLRELEHYVARPTSYLAVPAANRWLGAVTEAYRGRETILFPGLVTLALALPGAVLAWRRPETPAGSESPRGGRWAAVLDVALAVAILVTVANWLLVGGFVIRLGPLRFSQRHFGWPVVGIALVLAARRVVRGGPRPIRGLGWLRRLGWPNASGYYVGLTLVGVIASFGPQLWLGATLRVRPLYAQLQDLVPAVHSLRVPGRFGILVTTGLAVLAGFGAAALARWLDRPGWRTATLTALGALAVLETWVVPLPLTSVPTSPGEADRWLATRRDPEAVVVLPMYEARAVHLESVRLVGSTAHWHPLVNGYAAYFPPGYFADVGTLNAFPAPAAVDRLRALYVRYVVIHLGQYRAERRAGLEAALELLPPGVTRVAAFPQSQIFELGPAGARGSGAARDVDERPRAREQRGIGQAGRLERVEARGDREHGVQAVALRGEPLAPTLFPVDQDHQVLDDEPRGLEWLDRLQLRRPVGDDVVDHDDPLARLERALDPPPRAVRLLLAARVDEGHASRQACGHRERQPGVRDAGDPIDLAAGDRRGHESAHLRQHRRVGDHHAQVDVEGRGDPGLEDELAEADPADLVQPSHEREQAGVAHAVSSARIVWAAAAGSAAPVIGRPTTT